MVTGTVRGDVRGPPGLPDTGSVSREPVHQGAAGTQHTGNTPTLWKNTDDLQCLWLFNKHEILTLDCDDELSKYSDV